MEGEDVVDCGSLGGLIRDVHRTRTPPSGRFRTTVAVPVPFRVYFKYKYLDGRWTGRSTPVHDRQMYVRHGHQDGWIVSLSLCSERASGVPTHRNVHSIGFISIWGTLAAHAHLDRDKLWHL